MTANTPLPSLDSTRFVLVNTSHAGNVGAAARAIKVMGFSDLVLVAPRFADVLSREDTVAMASGAADILVRARVVASLDEALAGITTACATAMTPRDFGPPPRAPREYLPTLVDSVTTGVTTNATTNATTAAMPSPQRVAFVFGSERFGLRNEDVWRCHACLSIPTHPSYGSLNLAQAVQLIAYDWRSALGGYAVRPRTAEPVLADGAEVAGALAHWQQVLAQIGFLDPAVPRRLIPRLQQLINRAQPTRDEVHILRGIARAVAKAATGANAAGANKPEP